MPTDPGGVARRRALVVDAAFAAALAAATVPLTVAAGPMSGPGWIWFGVLFAPLAARRWTPRTVFWVVYALLLLALGLGVDAAGPHLIVVPAAALYSLARYRPRRDLWAAVVFVVPFAGGWVWAGGEWWDAAGMTALFVTAVLFGAYLQTRRAYLAELEERTRRLEREQDQQAQLAVAAERTRIAREMHDIVAHNLAVMVSLADGAAFTAAADPERAAATMDKISATGREALAEMRRLVGLLRDGEGETDQRAPQPGLADLDRLVEQVRAAGVRVAVTREGKPGAWGPGAGLAVYRIVQEALTNTLKHAGPHASAEVRLRYTSDGVDLEVTDDGAGRPARPAPVGGHGLAGMLERAAPYRGRVEAGPANGTGWRVRAKLHLGDRDGAL